MQDNTKTKKVYRFKTIVATDETRAKFTDLRNTLKTTDKKLMEVLFNLGAKYVDEVYDAFLDKMNSDLRTHPVQAKKAAKKKVTEQPVQEKVTELVDEDDTPCLVEAHGFAAEDAGEGAWLEVKEI